MQHIQHLSFESLVKMDHFQKEPPLKRAAVCGGHGVKEAIFKSLAQCQQQAIAVFYLSIWLYAAGARVAIAFLVDLQPIAVMLQLRVRN
jgi:hypothetical protein